MVAAPHDGGNFHTPEVGRLGPLRVLKEPVLEALLDGGVIVTEHTGDQAGSCLDDHQRRQLPPSEHHIAHRDLLVAQSVEHSLIDPLVATTQQ